jgi:indole-3-glycerol phosphate synthase
MFHARIDYNLPADVRGTMLEDIMQDRLRDLTGAMQKWPAVAVKQALERAPEIRSFRKALFRQPPGIIAEIKKASPSAGLLRESFDPTAIAAEYESAGAAAISVVTETKFFRGSLENIAQIRWGSRLPLLRKDFVIDPYQVVEARHAGADAVLLVAALLDTASLKSLRQETEEYGMEALIEVHDEAELDRALEAGASLIGVNNRDLRTLEVNFDTSLRLAPRMPSNVAAVAESGIRTSEDVRRLSNAGYRGMLVGESLLRASSPGKALRELLTGAGQAARKAS